MTIDRIHPLIPFFGIIDHMEEDRNLRLGYRARDKEDYPSPYFLPISSRKLSFTISLM